MKKENRMLKQLFVMGLVFVCAALVFGEGEKARMAQRLPKIDALKTAGVIGEKADGLLGFVKVSPADQALVDAENKDRQTVYRIIAQKQGVSAESVAKTRATTFAERAVSGLWLQTANGKWVQKQ